MLTVIDRDVEFDGPLSVEQRERLLAIASRCPAHLTLTSRIDIRTTLRGATVERVSGDDLTTS
jgi:putative redox protein